ncbi:MAG: PAS domain S-box protein [Deltaproteobacteria bacterium]|nr:PAS domain S-box protein [Deltaproteobacteria bacterium]
MINSERKVITSIFEAMKDAVYIIDDDFNVEYMNDEMMENYGQGVGQKCHKIFYGRNSACEKCLKNEVFDGKTVHWEHHDNKLNKTFDITDFPLKNPDGSISKVSIFRDITKRIMSEERLKVTEEDYKRLFEHVGAGVYVSSKEGEFLDANQALLDMLGYESKEEFFKIDIVKDLYLRPKDRRKFQGMIERDGRVIDYEVEFKRKDGKTIPVLLTSHVRYDRDGNVLGYEGINIDQTQRKKMEKELKEAHDFLNKIIQSSPNAIIAADMEGKIILFNRGAEEILGYKAKDVIWNMNVTDIYPKGIAREVMKLMRSTKYGGRGILNSYPMVQVRQDGEVLDGNLSAAIIYDSHGKEIFTVGIFVDLIERLAMERKLRDTQEQLLQSEKLAAMGRLTSQVAHELNNPLYGIMNTLELLKTEVSPQSKRRKILDMALSETVRLTDLLRKMLSFSRPDEEERQVTDINTILDEILLLVGKQLQENSIRISSSFDEIPGMVFASRNQLRQVFLNMIANAKDAMPDGGTLTINTMNDEGKVCIEITDTGIGIKKKNINKIFDTFFTTKDNIKDVGLGLSVCYGFIKDHEGDIDVSSKWGQGTTFNIILPKYIEESK